MLSLPDPDTLRLRQRAADLDCRAVSRDYSDGVITFNDWSFWMAEFCHRWTDATRLLAAWGVA